MSARFIFAIRNFFHGKVNFHDMFPLWGNYFKTSMLRIKSIKISIHPTIYIAIIHFSQLVVFNQSMFCNNFSRISCP